MIFHYHGTSEHPNPNSAPVKTISFRQGSYRVLGRPLPESEASSRWAFVFSPGASEHLSDRDETLIMNRQHISSASLMALIRLFQSPVLIPVLVAAQAGKLYREVTLR